MATLTLPMCAPSFSDPAGPMARTGWRSRTSWSGGGARGVGLRIGLVSGRAAALVVDELGQPADLAVHRLQAVPLQLERVAVDPLAGAGQRRAQALALPLHGPAPALEDLQPGL